MRIRTIPGSVLAMPVAALIAIAGAAVAQPRLPTQSRDATYWIVLEGGQRIPALGKLDVRPPVAWFRSLNGVLLSVRLDLVDLGASRAANRSASPLAARNVEIATPAMPAPRPPTPARRVGLVGEAAKRAGKSGTFTDLSGCAVAPAAKPATRRRAADTSR